MQLLQEMDGVKASARHVFVLAATNLIDVIDPAICSRFEEKIEIGYPSQPERQRLFRLMLSKQRVDFDRDAVAEELSQLTDNLAGRDIRACVQRASQSAVRRAAGNPKALMLTRADLLNAAPAARPASPIRAVMPEAVSSASAEQAFDQLPKATATTAVNIDPLVGP
jgi:SpoVK/Ycf46/Vps4 family AAA+-type ATPase